MAGTVRLRMRGAGLIIALVVLTAMSLAALALVRTVGTGLLVAGNLAFRQAAVLAADAGGEAAIAWLLPRAVGASKAAEMAFTGEALNAQQALACGLVSRVVPHDQLLDEALALARRIAANPGGVLRMTKRLLREGERSSLESLLELSAGYQAIAHMTDDHHEAVRAFIEKRPPQFK